VAIGRFWIDGEEESLADMKGCRFASL